MVKTMLGAIFPSIYTLHNTFSSTTSMSTSDFLCFVLFILFTLPCLFIPPEKLQKPFIMTACTSSLTAVVLLIWSLVRSKGELPLFSSSDQTSAIIGAQSAKGSRLVWAIFLGISTTLVSRSGKLDGLRSRLLVLVLNTSLFVIVLNRDRVASVLVSTDMTLHTRAWRSNTVLPSPPPSPPLSIRF